ncbi:MAG: 50S ribosomal protein L11 methyltransferase, partial [Bacteroidota bacterium]
QGALQNLRRLFNRSIPQWHFTMLADDARNEVYQKALEKAIRPSDLVLDIGAGSGLLSMMAARAGARQVVACEMQPMLAKAATQIVADNQFADRIQVHALKSLQLSVGRELSEPVDLIVSEILDCGGLGEAVLPSVRHAVNHLAKPDVRIIPSRLVLHAQLMEIPSRSRVVPVRDICGFDLSAFDRFRVPNEYIRIDLGAEDYKPLSDVVQFEDIDFYNMPPAYADDDPLRKNLDFSIQQSGQLQAVVFWFDLYLDDELKVSSGLGGELVHWGQALYCFERPTEVVAGAQLSIKMLRSDQMIRFAL